MDINTILFDLDGTLINTNDLILESFKHTFAHYYPDGFKETDLLKYIGEPLYTTFERFDKTQANDMLKMYREHNIAHHDKLIKQFDGVFETVRALDEQGFKLGVVTTKMRESAELGLELTHLAPFFDVMITLNEVKHAKPHPEPIEKAMALLKAEPETTLMIGDSQYDIEAGKNAGTYTAGVAWSLKGKDFLAALHPDMMLETMPELLDIVGVNPK